MRNRNLCKLEMNFCKVLIPHGISRMYTQLRLKSKTEPFESKPLHGYVHKKLSENSDIE